MCGFAVVLHRDAEIARKACGNAIDAMVHRGPDGDGILEISTPAGSLVLGHRRLAILDLSPTGAQPMRDESSGNAIVFNGEIYNFRALRKELAAAGKQFRGTSDTEVLLLGYYHWGFQLFDRLRGMFALAIWDAAEKRLVLARDHAGMKPLYWHQSGNTMAVASETQALLKTKLFQPKLSGPGLTGFLAYGSVLEPNSIFQDVSMLRAGSWVSIQLGTSAIVSDEVVFWTVPREVDNLSTFDFKAGLENSVKGHLESDVPVGVFLSGGVDSTAIAETAAKFCSNALRTFTVGFGEDCAIDETSIAIETAARLGTSHQVVTFTEQEARHNVERWLLCLDQPSLDGFNTFLVSKAARETGIKVALSGLGGDELFGGYSTFRTLPKLMRRLRPCGMIPLKLRTLLASAAVIGKSAAKQGQVLDFAKNMSSVTAMIFSKRRLFSDRELISLRGVLPGDLSDFVLPAKRSIPEAVLQRDDIPAAIAAFEASFYMKDTLLRDSDISGMAHGFEIRLPLLDRDLMEAALQLPEARRMGDFSINKPVLVAAAGARTKEVSKFKKRGFSLPYANWIKGPLCELFEHGIESAIRRGAVARQPSRNLFDAFVAGKTPASEWSRIWAIGTLGNWLDRVEVTA